MVKKMCILLIAIFFVSTYPYCANAIDPDIIDMYFSNEPTKPVYPDTDIYFDSKLMDAKGFSLGETYYIPAAIIPQVNAYAQIQWDGSSKSITITHLDDRGNTTYSTRHFTADKLFYTCYDGSGGMENLTNPRFGHPVIIIDDRAYVYIWYGGFENRNLTLNENGISIFSNEYIINEMYETDGIDSTQWINIRLSSQAWLTQDKNGAYGIKYEYDKWYPLPELTEDIVQKGTFEGVFNGIRVIGTDSNNIYVHTEDFQKMVANKE